MMLEFPLSEQSAMYCKIISQNKEKSTLLFKIMSKKFWKNTV